MRRWIIGGLAALTLALPGVAFAPTAACAMDANGQAACFGVCPCPFGCYCVGRDVGPGHCVGG